MKQNASQDACHVIQVRTVKTGAHFHCPTKPNPNSLSATLFFPKPFF